MRLQLRFKPHLDRRSAQEVIVLQSCGSSNLGNFETPICTLLDSLLVVELCLALNITNLCFVTNVQVILDLGYKLKIIP
jgi:hypothetical protein